LLPPGSPLIGAGSTTDFDPYVANAVTSTTVTPVTDNVGSSVTVNGAAVASGTAFVAFNLAVGGTVITVAVTAADGVITMAYTFGCGTTRDTQGSSTRMRFDLNDV